MHRTSRGDDMPSRRLDACGLDKQKQNVCLLTNVLLLLVETIGIEPMTPCMSSRYSNQLSYASIGYD